ncbi:MAG: hypothetical protein A2086_02440 [Spirochaetes bacterium GWD1_27_9]|nr:MAG: hypothetical protein A2Z98_08305 [Spirochaetes bacterium GWB1_27_13]OHD27772.1 MAG: hypothetical protein A2Y34_09035 [Spirochaetes bacterium GWC1_27_15]OHD31589.1 MAG: hypothetical protein A2086_02440 [Spirochaetes bacterium GWD1_27_9]
MNLKILIFSTIILILTFTGCKTNLKTGEDKMEKNKEIALGVSKSIMSGDWDKVNQLLDDNFTYIGDGNPPMNKQQYIGFMKNVLCTSMTEMDMKFLRVIGEGELVAVDYTNEMTNSGSFMGIPATGKRILATGMFIREVKNGKVTAEWQTTNMFGLMKDLGVIPSK